MASVRSCTSQFSLKPPTWSQADQVSLTLAQRPGAGRELSEDDEKEQMELSSEGLDTARRRNRYGSGKKVTGVGAREANQVPSKEERTNLPRLALASGSAWLASESLLVTQSTGHDCP